MAHIHTAPGQVDFVADVFVVCRDRVLLRLHDKYGIWLPPGGHIELDEAPEDAAVREVEEEVGLKVRLWKDPGGRVAERGDGGILAEYRELLLPAFMNIHRIGPDHRHISLVYFATSDTDETVQPDSHEKTVCRWLSRKELEAAEDVAPAVKAYALCALERLGREDGRYSFA
jgi:8-oxo-dGTP diphosphatase